MTAADVDEFLDLLELVAAERRYIGTEAPIDRAATRERFLERIESDRYGSLLAVSGDGRIVGEIGLKDMNGLVEIGMLVAPGRRREASAPRCLTRAWIGPARVALTR